MGEVVNQAVDGLLLNLYVVQPDAQVGRQVQFAGQVAQHALEKRVDGLNAEVVVVVEQQVEGLAGTTADECLGQTRQPDNVLKVVV